MSRISTQFIIISEAIHSKKSSKPDVNTNGFKEFEGVMEHVDSNLPTVSDYAVNNVLNFSRSYRVAKLKNKETAELYLN